MKQKRDAREEVVRNEVTALHDTIQKVELMNELERKVQQDRRRQNQRYQNELQEMIVKRRQYCEPSMSPEEERINKKFTDMLQMRAKVVNEIKEKEMMVRQWESRRQLLIDPSVRALQVQRTQD